MEVKRASDSLVYKADEKQTQQLVDTGELVPAVEAGAFMLLRSNYSKSTYVAADPLTAPDWVKTKAWEEWRHEKRSRERLNGFLRARGSHVLLCSHATCADLPSSTCTCAATTWVRGWITQKHVEGIWKDGRS